MRNILIVYYSLHGATQTLAEHIAQGVLDGGCLFTLRTVPKVGPLYCASEPDVPSKGAQYVQPQDLQQCDGVILGSPSRFGQMAAPMKYFIDGLSQEWLQGTLVGKPAAFFTTSSSLHGGQEMTLLSMMIPLLHQGALIVGLPYHGHPELSSTSAGGTPYGASHWAHTPETPFTEEEIILARALGKRVAQITTKLR